MAIAGGEFEPSSTAEATVKVLVVADVFGRAVTQSAPPNRRRRMPLSPRENGGNPVRVRITRLSCPTARGFHHGSPNFFAAFPATPNTEPLLRAICRDYLERRGTSRSESMCLSASLVSCMLLSNQSGRSGLMISGLFGCSIGFGAEPSSVANPCRLAVPTRARIAA